VPERYCDVCRTSGSYAEIPAKAIRSVFASGGGKSQPRPHLVMAIGVQMVRPREFIEATGELYVERLGTRKR
jgi:hypothetical protein